MDPDRRILVGHCLVGAVLVVAPLLMGSVHPLLVGVEALILAIAALLLVLGREAPPARLGPVGALLAVAVVWTALQLAPVPLGALRVLSPRAYAAHAEDPLLDPPKVASLSLDGPATAASLALAIALFALFVCVRNWQPPSAPRSRTGPLRLVALGAGVTALAAIAHAAVGAQRVFGLYTPLATRGGLVSLPLVNANHLAGLMSLGFFAFLGLVIDEYQRDRRWLWVGGAILCAVTNLLTLSRGGFASLAIGAAFFAVRVSSGRGQGWRVIPIVGVALGVAVLVAVGPLAKKLESVLHVAQMADSQRFVLLRDAVAMAASHFWTGSGRGTFVLAFGRFSTQSHLSTYTHPENLPLQLACEWGVPFAVLVLGILIVTWVSTVRRVTRGERIGPLAGVLAIFVHNLTDFSLEVAGIALPAVACLAISVARRSGGDDRPRSFMRPGLVAILLVGLGVAGLLGGIRATRIGYEVEGARLRQLADARASAAALRRAGRSAMRAHPVDPYIPLQVARGLIRKDARRALPFLNRALWLEPKLPGAHLLTGRALLRLGLDNQAMLHYRAAARWDPQLAAIVAEEVAAVVRDPAVAIRFAPGGAGGLGMLQTLAQMYLGSSDVASAELLARELARRSRGSPTARAFLARVLVAAHKPEEAIDNAKATRGTDQECAGMTWESEALRQLGRAEPASRVLALGIRKCPQDAAMRLALFDLSLERRDFERAEATLMAYRGIAGAEDPALAEGHFLEGRLEQARGRHAHAAAAYQRAVDLHPSRHQYLQAALEAWQRVGREDRVAPLRSALDGAARP